MKCNRLRAEELDTLICGSTRLDMKELQAVTMYKNGYHPHHPTIVQFWNVVHGWDDDTQKRFLAFCTGCDRAPVGGLKNLQFIIQRNNSRYTPKQISIKSSAHIHTHTHARHSDYRRLPTASTCFNLLHLPEYAFNVCRCMLCPLS